MISLQVSQLTKKFNARPIFQALNFEHRSGILGIAGENGSGKSTLMKCLSYLLRPNDGSIMWKDHEHLMNRAEVKSRIGMAAPYLSLYAELSVRENLEFLMKVSGGKNDADSILSLIEKVQIPHLKDQAFGSLSTGQQQRAKLAAALVRNPDILMLDEPGSNLDAKGHSLVTKIVEEKTSSGGLVILASNDPREIGLCDKVISMS